MHVCPPPTASAQAYVLTNENILQFKSAWMQLDPRGTQYIQSDLLLPLLQAVHYPLGIHGARTLHPSTRSVPLWSCGPLVLLVL